MSFSKSMLHCLNCEQSERETPLLQMRYNGDEIWICSQCLPTLIHAPQKLIGKLENAEQIRPAAHNKH
jgi:hypothetical protein